MHAFAKIDTNEDHVGPPSSLTPQGPSHAAVNGQRAVRQGGPGAQCAQLGPGGDRRRLGLPVMLTCHSPELILPSSVLTH
jgi:hypothetical protein